MDNLRLECLRLAIEAGAAPRDAVALAESYARYIRQDNVAATDGRSVLGGNASAASQRVGGIAAGFGS